MPLCFDCANRLVEIEVFCTMYRQTQAKLRQNIAACLKQHANARPTAISSVVLDRTDKDDDNVSDKCDTNERVNLNRKRKTSKDNSSVGRSKKSKDAEHDSISTVDEIARSTRVSANIERSMRSTSLVRRETAARESVGYILYSGSGSFQTHACGICTERYISSAYLRLHLIEQHAIVECTGTATVVQASATNRPLTSDESPPRPPPPPQPPQPPPPPQPPHSPPPPPPVRAVCDICGYTSSSSSVMRNHLRRHNNEKPVKCDRGCGMAFVCNSALQRHIRARHTAVDQRPYACGLCVRRFVTATHLQAHQATHTKQKEFHCDICGSPFAFKHNLITHRRRHEQSQFPCHHCVKVFISKKDRTIHVRREHPNTNVAT